MCEWGWGCNETSHFGDYDEWSPVSEPKHVSVDPTTTIPP